MCEPERGPTASYSLDRSNPTPLHHQLACAIEEAIRLERLPAGGRVENEVELSAKLGISRQTVRAAIHSLVRRGLLVRRPGYGTHVVDNAVQWPAPPSTLYADDEHPAGEPTTHSATIVLLSEVTLAPAAASAALRRPTSEQVFHLKRIRLQDGEPLAILDDFLPADLAGVGAQNLATISLYTAIERTGIRPRVATEKIGARRATEEECLLLQEPFPSVILTKKRTTHDDTGRVVDYGEHAFRSGLHTVDMTLVGNRTERPVVRRTVRQSERPD